MAEKGYTHKTGACSASIAAESWLAPEMQMLTKMRALCGQINRHS